MFKNKQGIQITVDNLTTYGQGVADLDRRSLVGDENLHCIQRCINICNEILGSIRHKEEGVTSDDG